MKQRRIYKRRMLRSTVVKWCISIIFIFSFVGISYAAHTNVLFSDIGFSTSSMSFIFDDDKDIVVEMTRGSDREIMDLGGKASYQDKKLIISDIGPIDMKDFAIGNVNITIRYAIKAEDDEIGIRRPAEVKEYDKNGYDLGTVPFERQLNTPVWSLKNGDRSWGTKTEGIGGTPAIVDKSLPDNLGEFHVYNQILPHYEEGVMVGTLLLKQESKFDFPEIREIGLKSFNLPSELTNEMQNDSLLEIQGTYGFTIPINLDQFNVDR